MSTPCPYDCGSDFEYEGTLRRHIALYHMGEEAEMASETDSKTAPESKGRVTSSVSLDRPSRPREDDWREQREKCFERDDYTCQSCGCQRVFSKETFKRVIRGEPPSWASRKGTRLEAHHIIPRRFFDDVERADRLGNLVTLCGICHGRWEGIPLKPQLIP